MATSPRRIDNYAKSQKRKDRQKEFRLSFPGVAYRLHRAAYVSAKKRGLEFIITRKQIEAKLVSGKCAVTGIPFSREPRDTRRGARKCNPFAPSLDRIQAGGGYTDANTQVVIFAVNVARWDWGDDTALMVARALVRALGRKLH